MELTLHKHATNHELAQVFAFIAGVISLKEGNSFRARAYQNAAVAIEQHPQQLHEMFLTNPDFDKIPGIGETLQLKLTELFTTGNVKAFQKYVADLPAGMWPLFHLSGLGAKKAFRLATTFKLNNAATAVAELLKHAQAGEVQHLDGFGVKSEQDLITILQSADPKPRVSLAEAQPIAEEVVTYLKSCPAIQKIEVLGSLRRQTATVGDIDIGIAATDMAQVKTFVQDAKWVKRVVVAGEQLIRIILQDDRQVDIKLSTPAEWGAFLQHFTGSKEHNIRLREFALKQGKSLSEHGIKYLDDQGNVTTQKHFADEKEFYAELGLAWIPTQKRLGTTELQDYRLPQ